MSRPAAVKHGWPSWSARLLLPSRRARQPSLTAYAPYAKIVKEVFRTAASPQAFSVERVYTERVATRERIARRTGGADPVRRQTLALLIMAFVVELAWVALLVLVLHRAVM